MVVRASDAYLVGVSCSWPVTCVTFAASLGLHNRMDMSMPDADEKTAQLYPQKESTCMTTHLRVNDKFPDIALPDDQRELRRLAHFTKSGRLGQHEGVMDGPQLILVCV